MYGRQGGVGMRLKGRAGPLAASLDPDTAERSAIFQDDRGGRNGTVSQGDVGSASGNCVNTPKGKQDTGQSTSKKNGGDG